MKTKLSLLFVLVLMAQASFAQFDIGIKAGTNMSKIDGKSFSEEFRYGYSLGGFATIGLGKKFSLQPEVLFNQSQTRTDTTFKAVYQNAFKKSASGDVKLNYLAIPIMLNYKLGRSFSLQAGPQFGILMNEDDNMLENGESAFSKGDLSLLGGAQLKISRFVVTGRYGIGLNNINDIDNEDQWKSQTIQLAVGFAF